MSSSSCEVKKTDFFWIEIGIVYLSHSTQMADFFEPTPKTPERKTNNSNPPNIKEERNRKRKATMSPEDLHISTVQAIQPKRLFNN